MSLLFFILIFFLKLFTTYACTPKLSIRHQPSYRRKRVTWPLLQEGFQEKLSWVGSLGHSFLSQMLRGSLFLSHNYGIEKQWPSAHSHLWSLSHQKRMPVWCVIAYSFCWSHLRFYPSKIPGLLAPVLVFLSLKLPFQLHAKSNNTFWKPFNSSQGKSSQSSKEKECWMGNQDPWVQVLVQQVISEVTLSTGLHVPHCASVFLSVK